MNDLLIPKILMLLVLIILLLTFLANPAPVSIEFIDMVIMGLTVLLAALCFAITKNYLLHLPQIHLLYAVMLYLIYLAISAFLGFLNGISILNILRSIGPYISFIPLLALGLMSPQIFTPRKLAIMLITIGFLQISYLFYLYFSHIEIDTNTNDVLRNRITLMDPRTTLPLLFSVAILPFIFLQNEASKTNNKKILLCALSSILIGMLAGMITLTRAIVLSIIVGWIVLASLNLFYIAKAKPELLPRFFCHLGIGLILIAMIISILALIPAIKLMAIGLFTRFFDQTANGANVDYSNGRLYDEWLPALTTWLNAGWVSFGFGIGAGNAFIVTSGEERTYIHNLSIYSLVYGGIFGLISCLYLYWILFKTLVIKAFISQNKAYLVFAALLTSLFFYAQLFAVHKGLAFNLMLFLIISLGLSSQREKKNVWNIRGFH